EACPQPARIARIDQGAREALCTLKGRSPGPGHRIRDPPHVAAATLADLKPKIRAYVIGPQSTDLDLFYTLPTALGESWEFEPLLLERETFTLELLPDVHRAHRIRNAILVVAPTSTVLDRFTRLAIAHAWREGVRRFILLLAGRRAPGPETHELEQ